MYWKEKILYITLSLLKVFFPFMKIRSNKIVFVSLESNKLENEFKMLSKQLMKDNQYDLQYVLFKFDGTLLGSVKYFFVCIHQFFEINTSKLVILDYNNYVVSKFKRKGVQVLQLWHASGAIKKFGNETKRDYPIANYDYVIANSDQFKPYYAKAFGVSEQQVIVTGIPKCDCLYNPEYLESRKIKIIEKYPQIQNKKIVLYAPTFRGRITSGFKNVYMDLNKLHELLGEEYVIMYKLHPLLKNHIISNHPNIICCNSENLYHLFSITDYFISDYSAIIFDFSIMNKPMIFYAFDLDKYKEETGIFLDYLNEMPGPVCYNEEEVANSILADEFDLSKIEAFCRKYHKYNDGHSLSRVLTLIKDIMSKDGA